MKHGDIGGKFVLNENSYLKIVNFNKYNFVCEFCSLLNFRSIGNINYPDAIDPSDGPMISIGDKINDGRLSKIWWDFENKRYLMMFERK